VVEGGGVLYGLLVELLGANALVFAILGAVMSFVVAMILNRMVFERRIGYHRDYFVALIYILLSGSLLAFQTLTPYLAGSVFILLAINMLFELSKEHDRREKIYYAGLFIGIAGLFTPYYFIFIVPAMLSMFLFGPFRLKEILALLLGWVNPVILVGVGYYLVDGFDYFWKTSFTFDYALYLLFNHWDWETYSILAIFILLVVVAVLMQPLLMLKQQHLSKRYIRVMYNFLFAAVGSLLFMELDKLPYLYLPVLFLAFLFGVYYKRRNGDISLAMELFHLVAFILVFFNLYVFHLG